MTTEQQVRSARRDATANREALLDAARVELNRDPDASLEAIAAAAGLTRRAVYGHFAGREALVAELAETGARRIAAAVIEVRDDDPLLDIALLGRLVWDEVEHVRAMANLVVRGPLRSRVGGTLGPIHVRIVDDVQRAAAAGSARTDITPDLVARLIEGAAFTVLDESIRAGLDGAEGRRLVILAGLGALGLSWREAGELITAHAGVLALVADR